MSENLNRGARDFSKYDTMETADLEEILRLDAELPEGAESDTELFLYVMEVLADRRKTSTHAGKTAFEAWESFEKNYMPEEEDASVCRKTGSRFAPWLLRAVAAAAVVALLVCLPLTAQAFGLGDIWDVFARWAKETFAFVSGENTELTEPVAPGEEGFASLQDALEKSNRDPSIAPTWVPEGYTFDSVSKIISPAREIYTAYYTNESQILQVIVQTYIADDPEKVEIDGSTSEVYTSNNVDYYIISNMDMLQAIWVNDIYECCIAGNVSLDEIKQIIDSIGKENA